MSDALNIPENEIHREFLGVVGLNPFINTVASARVQMASGQIGQHLDIAGACAPYIKTGMELEYGKTTFSIKMPHTVRIIKIVDLYPKLRSVCGNLNPVSYVLYEVVSDDHLLDGTIGIVELPKFGTQHQHFGYEYREGPAFSKVRPGNIIEAGEVILQTKSVDKETGEYMYGMQCNVAFMTHPATAEDGIVYSTSILDRLRFKMREKRVVEWGSNSYPLPLYSITRPDGVVVNKIFPDIGSYVREDGLLMVKRRRDDYHNLTELSASSLKEVNPYMDDCVYAVSPVGKTRGRVVDIRVYKNGKNISSSSPSGLDDQAEEYFRDRHNLSVSIKEDYSAFLKRGKKKFTPEFRQLLLDTFSITGVPTVSGNGKKESIRILYRKAKVDLWRAEFVIEYDIPAFKGSKLTGIFGDKGVCVKILPPEEMPVDVDGNRADIIMDSDSTVNRMNPGRLYASYINGASRDVLKRVVRKLEEAGFEISDRDIMKRLYSLDSKSGVVRECWDYMAGFYSIVSNSMKKWVETGDVDYVAHIASALKDRVIGRQAVEPLDIYFPCDDQVYLPKMVEELEKKYPQTYGPVSYYDEYGVHHTTKENIRIASSYVLLLEKIADEWSAVASGKLQHHGTLSKITNNDKYRAPGRESPTRMFGETEERLFAAYAGGEAVAEQVDRDTNPATHREIYQRLLTDPVPSCIENIVDRSSLPLGSDKPGQLISHIAEIGGFKFAYGPDE